MDQAIKKIWVEKLRSGEYKQGKGFLCQLDEYGNKTYCCWGVLCDIHSILTGEGYFNLSTIESGKIFKYVPNVRTRAGTETASMPPEYIFKWMGPFDAECICSGSPKIRYKESSNSLERLNDNGISFEEIADIIEEQF